MNMWCSDVEAVTQKYTHASEGGRARGVIGRRRRTRTHAEDDAHAPIEGREGGRAL